MNDYKIGTKCVQAGYTPENGQPRQIPIIQSTTFKYSTSEDMGKLFDLEAEGYFYSRLQNPTCDHVAAKIAAMEGGTAAMLTSSGQAANFYAMFNICECGDHIVASSSIYGGTFNLIAVTLAKMGITATFVSPDASEEELNAAFRPNTKLMFGETIANPALTVLDIELFAKTAHAHGVPLIIDNTFPTPVNCRPFEWGADIVTHSTTKYMDGHGAAVGGAIVDSGKFDWMAHADKYPGLCTPDESYHGVTYAEKFGNEGAFITKCTTQLMRDLGCIQSPQNAFLLNLGLESLHVRMPKHVENGQAVAEFLEKHPKVAYVNYPGLPSSKYYERARKYLPHGGCGVVSFGLKGGREAASAFMQNLKLGAIETHVADARTCCLNPATSTHRQMTDEQLKEAGVPAELIRPQRGKSGKRILLEYVPFLWKPLSFLQKITLRNMLRYKLRMTMMLVGIGLIMVFSASYASAYYALRNFDRPGQLGRCGELLDAFLAGPGGPGTRGRGGAGQPPPGGKAGPFPGGYHRGGGQRPEPGDPPGGRRV